MSRLRSQFMWVSIVAMGLVALVGTALTKASELTGSGTAQWNVIQTGHPLAKLSFGTLGESSVSEITGVVQDLSGKGPFHNMALNCLIHFQWIVKPRRTNGECVQTDSDGDQIFMTFAGSGLGVGSHTIIGGSGKFKGIEGSANFKVDILPSPREGIVLANVAYDVSWEIP